MTDLYPELERRWHALAVEVGSEDAIHGALMGFHGVTPYVPTYVTEEVEKRKRRTKQMIQVQHNALPGYVLLEVGPLVHWPGIQALDGVIEPMKFAGSDDYHIIPEPQIEALKAAERGNFGFPISMSKDDELQIGQQVLAIIGLVERKGEVVELAGRRAKVEFEGMGNFGPVDVARKDLARA